MHHRGWLNVKWVGVDTPAAKALHNSPLIVGEIMLISDDEDVLLYHYRENGHPDIVVETEWKISLPPETQQYNIGLNFNENQICVSIREDETQPFQPAYNFEYDKANTNMKAIKITYDNGLLSISLPYKEDLINQMRAAAQPLPDGSPFFFSIGK